MKVVVGLALGALFGYGYHRVVGCSSGSCPITANPWTSTAYGAILGLLITYQ